MAPRRRGNRRRRSGVKSTALRYSFTCRMKANVWTLIKYGQLGISADFPLKVLHVNMKFVSNGTCTVEAMLYGPGGESVANMTPLPVGQHTVTGRLISPPGTDFHLPANTESVLGIRMRMPQTDATTLLVTGVVGVQIRSVGTLAVLAGEFESGESASSPSASAE